MGNSKEKQSSKIGDVGEMAQGLRTLTALPKDPVQYLHGSKQLSITPIPRGKPMPSSGL